MTMWEAVVYCSNDAYKGKHIMTIESKLNPFDYQIKECEDTKILKLKDNEGNVLIVPWKCVFSITIQPVNEAMEALFS